jgi:hypothetical protein
MKCVLHDWKNIEPSDNLLFNSKNKLESTEMA